MARLLSQTLGAWLLAQPISTQQKWLDDPGLNISTTSFAEELHDPEDPGVITIVDNGLTEVAPGTPTARVYLG